MKAEAEDDRRTLKIKHYLRACKARRRCLICLQRRSRKNMWREWRKGTWC